MSSLWAFPKRKEDSSPDLIRLSEYFQNAAVIKGTIVIKSIAKLPKIKGSALIIDKPMASTCYFQQIAEISKYKGTIICCDRSLFSIINYHIPNYVCNLDSSPLCFSFFDRPDVEKIMSKVTAVFATTTNPLTIRFWHGKRVFFTGNIDGAHAIAQATDTPVVFTGGQVACFAWVLAYFLGANPIGIYGIMHGYDKLAETEYPKYPKLHKKIKGPYGLVWQDPVYAEYNEQFLMAIKRACEEKNVSTINTNRAGLLYSGDVVDKTLKEFVETYD